MEKKETSNQRAPYFLMKFLNQDVIWTDKVVHGCLRYTPFKSLLHCSMYLEYSCNGIVWLVSWFLYFYLLGSNNTYHLLLNLLVGLLLDIVIIAVLKAFVRRRRPEECKDAFGPDKFSFPSGHASRAIFMVWFFTNIFPVSVIWWPPLFAWGCSVCMSRLLLRRHYIFDVIAGVIIGIFEGLLLKAIMLNHENSIIIMNFFYDDNSVEGE